MWELKILAEGTDNIDSSTSLTDICMYNSMAERWPPRPKVVGSSPITCSSGNVQQSYRLKMHSKLQVVGSSPTPATNFCNIAG